ncbi:type III-B CRISPR module-associated protein Cmr5 [Saccharolobus shibatae]|uniref:CRISPR type III-B/RAMP module-associated protein Cmr5 n=1 Tax=Saccharolobus shibatae TaxID=2286 RepID=A0A8F5GW81_9CREN|nr:type III-B CRISPR module-associated protein Cmr5 [Saccharolobus shibatae]QXJ31903.1 CRISPR-associated RAMP Cmr5 [Saccharolobus shibatae]QXJ34909.1 CRISPR-associated RAMP Cmr5 [Saccharolobus shibatae]
MNEVDYPLDIGEKLLELAIYCKRSVRGFRSRAREMPQMIQQLGLIPSLTFLLSKIDDKNLIPSIQYFIKGKEIKDENNLCEEIEDKGYTSYLVVSFAWIKLKLNDVQFIDKCDNIEELTDCIKKDYISVLKTLKNDKNLLSKIEDSVLNFSIELKKIVDGIYGGEGDRGSS